MNCDEEKGLTSETRMIKHHLIQRKELHFRCRQVNDFMCIIALAGLLLMIIDTELRLNETNSKILIFIRPSISILTILLVGLIFYYHALDIRLYTINNHIADWRVTIDFRAILLIICEILVCSIHPLPFYDKPLSKDSAWLKIFLTFPMFGRLYLIARGVTLHSQLVNTASSRTIGYLNRVPVTISFILRAFLQIYPGSFWTSVLILLLFISTWLIRTCEKGMWLPIQSSSTEINSSLGIFSNAMWFTIVTFTTVGYGDLVPQTYCGQGTLRKMILYGIFEIFLCLGVSIMIAFVGVFASAVLIAVFTNKISLNRSEQVVLDFVARINRARAYRKKTMEIIQYSVRAWFLKRHGHHYRALFNSLYRLHTAMRQARRIKQEQRNATNSTESVMTTLSDIRDEQQTSEKSLNKIKQQITQVEEKLLGLENKLNTVVNILTHTVSERQQHSWLILCDFWHAIDIFASTASILGLCTVGIDRYVVIKKPIQYPNSFISKRWHHMLSFIWICSALIAFPAILYWGTKQPVSHNSIISNDTLIVSSSLLEQCDIPNNAYYVLFSSMASFYLPLVLMIYVYIQIYLAAKDQTFALHFGYKQHHHHHHHHRIENTKMKQTMIIDKKSSIRRSDLSLSENQLSNDSIMLRIHHGTYRKPILELDMQNTIHKTNSQNFWRTLSNTQKATRFVGIVMGTFLLCWLPYFVYLVLSGVFGIRLKDDHHHEVLYTILSWLGYSNSALDIIVYVSTSTELRTIIMQLFHDSNRNNQMTS
ncbi:hypothetical protein I4U23_015670 [Adineta vaga]|nr:hypothetical protein I4U23_015670 [Adineta vaga]